MTPALTRSIVLNVERRSAVVPRLKTGGSMIQTSRSKKIPTNMKTEKHNPLSKLVVLSAGGKGGVGKTLTVSAIADFYHENGIQPAMFDADVENKQRGSLSHFFPEAKKLNIRSDRGMDEFIDAAVSTPSRIVLADLGAGSGHDTFKWFDAMHDELSGVGIRFTAVVTITSSAASVETVFSWAQALGNRVRYLITENRVAGDDFGYLHDTEPGRAFLSVAKPHIIRLEQRVAELQSELENRGLTARTARLAMTEARGPYLDRLSSLIRLQGYANRLNTAFSSAHEFLLP